MNRFLLLSFCLLFLLRAIPCLSEDDPCLKTTEGKDFWFGFMQKKGYKSSHFLVTMTTTFGNSTYQIFIGNSTTPCKTGSLVQDESVPVDLAEYFTDDASESESVQNRAIHITSTNPMSVYVMNFDSKSADVSLVFPTTSLGKDYFVASYKPMIKKDSNGVFQSGWNSEFLVVATDDNTEVSITPTRNTEGGKIAKSSYVVILNKGDIYQVQSKSSDDIGDLSGSQIQSSKPVAVFSGCLALSVSGMNYRSWNYFYEQMLPIQSWGRKFMAVPFKSRTKDVYQLVAAYDNTYVSVGSEVYSLKNKGDIKFFECSNPCMVESSKPVLLVQYSKTLDDTNYGDPVMVVVSPLQQTNYRISFDVPETNAMFVNVISKDEDIRTVKLDQSPISFTSLVGTGYSYAQISFSTNGSHTILGRGFIACVYGLGGSNSYGFSSGYSLNIQLALNSVSELCKDDSRLDAGAYFDKYEWNTGETSPFIIIKDPGKYSVTASTLSGCVRSAESDVELYDPQINLGDDIHQCGFSSIVLDAGTGVDTYLWQDGSTGKIYSVTQSGDYKVTGTKNYHGGLFSCKVSDEIHVDIKPLPTVELKGKDLVCGELISELSASVSGVDPSLWNIAGAAKWSSTPLGVEFIEPENIRSKFKASSPGLYTINYKLTTKDNCTTSSSFKVGLYETPQSLFKVESPGSTDRCGAYGRIVEYVGNASSLAQFNWDFGGLMVLENYGSNKFKVSIGANNPQRTIKLTVKDNGCLSPETVKELGVTPQFSFNSDKTHGCNSLSVNLTAKVVIDDPVSYLWTFGDGTGSTDNPVQHTYKATGSYDVSLKVVNLIDGCADGWTEKNMIVIDPIPRPQMLIDKNRCFDTVSEFSGYGLSSGSKCEWYTEGNRVLSNTNEKAVYSLDKEFSTIGFRIEENGCTSDWLKFEVKRKPKFDFSASSTDICLPDTVHLKASSSDPFLNYTWNLNSFYGNSSTLDYKFENAGKYSVKLTAKSSLTECSDVLEKDDFIRVNPLPLPKFSHDFDVATEEHPLISFTNQTEGAAKFLWRFGDEQTSEEENPQHLYSKIGIYKVLMKAETEFGCVDTVSSSVKIIPYSFFVPNAFRPDSKIEENRVFIPVKDGVDPQKYHLEIFNRMGSVVFETNNAELGWSGKLPNGSDAEPGIYVWIIKYHDMQGFFHNQKGTVMLVR